MSSTVEFILKLKDMMSGGMQAAASTARRAMDSTQAAIRRVPRAANEAGQSMRRLANDARQAERDMGKLEGRSRSLIGSLGGFRGLVAGAGLMAGLGGVVNAGMQAQQQKASFEVMAGQQAGGKLYGDLTKFAQDSIFGNEVYQNAQTMKAFGIETEKVMPTLKMLGDISMGNKERLGSLSLAYSQVMTTGRLMGQDLLQLVNAGFNPLKIISEKTGIGMADLKKKMENGAISAKMVEMAFQAATGPGGQFFDMTNKIAQTDFGKLEAVKGQISGLAMQVGGILAPVIGNLITNYIAPFVTWLGETVKWLHENWHWIGLVTSVIAGAASPILLIIGIIKTMVLAVKAWAAIQAVLNVILTANPIGIIIVAVAALVAGIIYAYNHFEGFRNVVDKVWLALKGFGSMIKDVVITHIKNMLAGISGMGKALYLFFTGEWKQAWEVGKRAVMDLSGVNTVMAVREGAENLGQNWSNGVAVGINRGRGAIELAKSRLLGTGSAWGNTFNTSAPSILDLAKGVGERRKADADRSAIMKDSFTKELALGGGKSSKLKSDGITSGGPKTITINVNKEMIGQLAINSYNVKEGIGEMEGLIEEALRRLLHSAAAAN